MKVLFDKTPLMHCMSMRAKVKGKNLFSALPCILFCVASCVAWMGAFLSPAEAAPVLSEAQGAILCDNNGNELYGYNEEGEFPPASITKIMTAMIALDSQISFDAQITIPEMPSEWQNAQEAGFTPGSCASFGDLMAVMLVYSANDAAYSVAVAVAGSEEAFSQLMNAKAAQLGMSHTNFVTSSGMEAPNHYSCARDLAAMGRYALLNYPYIARMVHTPSCTILINGAYETYYSTDKLMQRYAPLIGIKTGAGENTFTFLGAARKDGLTLYSCVLGCATEQARFNDTQAMFEWAYSNYYKEKEFCRENQYVGKRPYALCFGWEVWLVYEQDARGLVGPTNSFDYVRKLPSSSLMLLPNQVAGMCSWYEDGREVASSPLKTTAYIVKKQPYNPFIPPFMEADQAVQANPVEQTPIHE